MRTPDDTLRAQLISRAQKLAEERGWTWLDPVEVTSAAHRGHPVWIIRTNAVSRGRNARIVLRQSDHAVIQAGYLSR
jgi:hypothetical protein